MVEVCCSRRECTPLPNQSSVGVHGLARSTTISHLARCTALWVMFVAVTYQQKSNERDVSDGRWYYGILLQGVLWTAKSLSTVDRSVREENATLCPLSLYTKTESRVYEAQVHLSDSEQIETRSQRNGTPSLRIRGDRCTLL